MNDKRIDCLPQLIKLVDRQFIQLFEVVLYRIDYLLMRALHGSQKITCDSGHNGSEEQHLTKHHP